MSDVNAAIVALVQGVVQQMIPNIVQAVQQQLSAQAPQMQPQMQQQPANANLGFTPPPAQPQAGNVTPDMMQALVVKLVSNEAAKAAAVGAMQSMGIANLPDTRPDQMPELYAKFQQIEAQYFGNQAQGMANLGGFGAPQPQAQAQAQATGGII